MVFRVQCTFSGNSVGLQENYNWEYDAGALSLFSVKLEQQLVLAENVKDFEELTHLMVKSAELTEGMCFVQNGSVKGKLKRWPGHIRKQKKLVGLMSKQWHGAVANNGNKKYCTDKWKVFRAACTKLQQMVYGWECRKNQKFWKNIVREGQVRYDLFWNYRRTRKSRRVCEKIFLDDEGKEVIDE